MSILDTENIAAVTDSAQNDSFMLHGVAMAAVAVIFFFVIDYQKSKDKKSYPGYKSAIDQLRGIFK